MDRWCPHTRSANTLNNHRSIFPFIHGVAHHFMPYDEMVPCYLPQAK
jgi:hypothetical protein